MNKHLHISSRTNGQVAELVYALVLGTNTEGCKGSSPFLPTKKTRMVDTPVFFSRVNVVNVGVKINEVGCDGICNRASVVAMDKKLSAVVLNNSRNTSLRKYQDNFHRFNSASYYCNPSSILAFSNNFTSELFLQPLQIVHCKHSLVQR